MFIAKHSGYFTLKLMMEPIKIKFINLRIALNSILNYIYLKMMKRNLLEVYINDLLIGGINFNFLLHFLMMILMIEKCFYYIKNLHIFY